LQEFKDVFDSSADGKLVELLPTVESQPDLQEIYYLEARRQIS
jgi:hypothetical protein